MSAGKPPGPPPGAPPITNGVARPPGPPPGGPAGAFRPPPMQGQYPPMHFPPAPGMQAPMMPNFPPPLPPGWSEHTAPDGRTKYYYNSNTKTSTYNRPTFPGPFPAFPPNGPNTTQFGEPSSSTSKTAPVKEKKKKEKAKEKIPIPGTSWQRIRTNEGNVFYFEKETKRSEWTIPAEIKDEVAQLEREEMEKMEAEAKAKKEEEEKERLEQLREQERIKLEVEEERRKKRKLAEDRAEQAKKQKKDQDDTNENGDGDGQDERDKRDGADGDEDGDYGPVDEEDEEAWMKAVAAEFAEAEAKEKEENEESEEKRQETEEEAVKKVFSVPEKVTVSLEEQRALFRALLAEKDISPFAPWDQSLPLFINDPRYILLSSVKDRREVYEEYCRDVGRARRLNKASGSASTEKAASETKKHDPERDYKALMRDEVTSTRMRFDDYKKKFKKDRRFYSFGRDDREREKAFKAHLRELGERKRADAHRAEMDFLELLKEQDGIKGDSKWSEVKRGISSDARYDAVGSSSLREQLFNDYVKKLAVRQNGSKNEETPEEAAERKLKERKAKAEASLREREAKVREEKGRVDQEVGKSRAGAGREEAERLFGSLLVDQVRDHEVTWNQAVEFLSSDPRFNHPALSPFDKQRLFSAHIKRISSKRSNALHQLFETHSPSLDTTYEKVYPHVIDDPIVKRLDLTLDQLEDRYEQWKEGKQVEAKREFDQMLGENSFVDFWSRMRKKVNDEENAKLLDDDGGGDDEEGVGGDGIGEGGNKDLAAMGRQIDLEEIKAVLRRDKRYRQFDHVPEKREKWLRDYLENIEAASGSRTIHNVLR